MMMMMILMKKEWCGVPGKGDTKTTTSEGDEVNPEGGE